jgi:hypothetical protein
MIKSRHRVRNEIASLSNYYPYKSDAIAAADKVLDAYDWTTDGCNLPDDDGRTLVPIVTKEDAPQEVGNIMLSWHRMPSGRYEVTMYCA